ncbi:SigE family RNA polymerase sigma factor [Streptomyces sp. S1A]|uniref:SigE family RNA polymerase sigma factor n=1 Tax=Streptomyces sp. ICN903 TaxID=2964654 RepID=UPI001EDBC985|nr:SigE family RNA polymerase sigma factor [Streptomyces sp. ICN903]MCG3043497.1 SigE family RNA polymerase sigma factor [Streptomyces sp. ICN903]
MTAETDGERDTVVERPTQRLEEFREFASSSGSRLFRTALLLTGGDWHQAEDLTQTALGRAFASWRRVRRADDPDAYVRTIMVRAHISQRRLRRSGERPVEAVPEAAVSGGSDPALRVTLLRVLGELPHKDRAVLVLRYWEDRSVEQTATELGVSAGSVRNRSMRALARLRDALGGELDSLANG